MPKLPEQGQQIVQAHAVLIHHVVMACLNRERLPEVEPLLKASAENGWTALVAAVRLILAGRRDAGVLAGLDEEDSVIIRAILLGLQDPATLPDPKLKPDPALAAPGLAAMIQAAATGDVRALQLTADMAEQMSRAGGEMARLAAILRPLINGERDPESLCKGMGVSGQGLVLLILQELGRLRQH